MLAQNSEVFKLLVDKKKRLEISAGATKKDIADVDATLIKKMLDLAEIEKSLREIEEFLAVNTAPTP